MRRVLGHAGLVLALLSLTVAAEAQTTSYSDETAFRAAILNPTTVSFDAFPTGFLPQSTLKKEKEAGEDASAPRERQ